MKASSDLIFERPGDYLELEYKRRLARRPAYSMRAFARDLQISPASLTEFMHGRQGMSLERVSSIAKILGWSEERKAHVWDLIQARHSRDQGQRRAALLRANERLQRVPKRIRLDHFKLISDWYHIAILEFVRIRPDSSQAGAVAQSLGLSVPVAREALERLARLGFLEKADDGWRSHIDCSHFGDEAPSEAVRAYHHQVLSLGQEALEKFTAEERQSLSVIFSGRQENLKEMHREIREAVLSIVSRYSRSDREDTIQALTLQIFPLWQERKSE